MRKSLVISITLGVVVLFCSIATKLKMRKAVAELLKSEVGGFVIEK